MLAWLAGVPSLTWEETRKLCLHHKVLISTTVSLHILYFMKNTAGSKSLKRTSFSHPGGEGARKQVRVNLVQRDTFGLFIKGAF